MMWDGTSDKEALRQVKEALYAEGYRLVKLGRYTNGQQAYAIEEIGEIYENMFVRKNLTLSDLYNIFVLNLG